MPQKKILVVDDELFVRELMVDFFSKEGYQVCIEENGERAVQKITSGSFDIALIDLKMPGMDGLKTLKEIKKLSPSTLSVIMTGYPTIETCIDALRSGAFDYVVKPFKLAELKSCVDKAIEKHRHNGDVGKLHQRIKSLEDELEIYKSNS